MPDANDKPATPVLIELDGPAPAGPAEAAPVPDPVPDSDSAAEGAAMQAAATLAARRPSRIARWFWALAGALLGLVASLSAWDFLTALLARNPLLGAIATALAAALLLLLAALALSEWLGLVRLARIDRLQRAGEAARSEESPEAAQQLLDRLLKLYASRPELAWGRTRLATRRGEIFDAADLLDLAEAELLAPLDALATREVEAAARQVATVTAIVPLALADVATALFANLRMIRRVAEIYGGRAGLFGSWRLMRAVMTHLVATGAVAVGDDLIHSLAGGSLLSKLSRRFGEGMVNGALTARVGIAAMEVCRPLPFSAARRPTVSRLVTRALAGLFGREKT